MIYLQKRQPSIWIDSKDSMAALTLCSPKLGSSPDCSTHTMLNSEIERLRYFPYICAFMKVVNGGEGAKFSERLKTCLLPVDFITRPKRVNDLSYWKAADIKVPVFYLMSLGMDSLPRISNNRKKSFSTLFPGIRKWWLTKLRMQRQLI